MDKLNWLNSFINKISSYLSNYEKGILNLLTNKYNNKKYKLHIESLILNNKMRKWYINYFNDKLNYINSYWAVKNSYPNCFKYLTISGNQIDKKILD